MYPNEVLKTERQSTSELATTLAAGDAELP